jgi:hypothetical protein
MTYQTLTEELQARGVRLQEAKGGLIVSPVSALTPGMREAVREYKPLLLSQLCPDETLPDEIYIPASISNDLESIEACIDAQRLDRRAA